MDSRRIIALVGVLVILCSGPFSAAASTRAEQCYAATGFCIQGRFLDYWLANGGLERNGYPLTGERRETLEDGNEYTVQYFERVRLEYHPENAAPHDVLLGQFGRRILRENYILVLGATYEEAIAPVAPLAGARFFPETGHNISPRFRAYWEANGGLAQFGYPITEERYDSLGPRGCCTTQYFERARFEWRPENEGTPYVILLAHFGRTVLESESRLQGEFGALYRGNDQVRAALGRPTALATTTRAATQPFAGGRMYWLENGPYTDYDTGMPSTRTILALCGGDESGAILSSTIFPFAPDTWTEGQEPGGGAGPLPGLYLPQRGFGKLWRENAAIRECLGYASAPEETSFVAAWQPFTGGILLLDDRPEGRSIYSINVRRNCNSCGNTITYQRYGVPGR